MHLCTLYNTITITLSHSQHYVTSQDQARTSFIFSQGSLFCATCVHIILENNDFISITSFASFLAYAIMPSPYLFQLAETNMSRKPDLYHIVVEPQWFFLSNPQNTSLHAPLTNDFLWSFHESIHVCAPYNSDASTVFMYPIPWSSL